MDWRRVIGTALVVLAGTGLLLVLVVYPVFAYNNAWFD